MRSPSLILSPSFFSQRAMVPICIVGDRAGKATCEEQSNVTTQTTLRAGTPYVQLRQILSTSWGSGHKGGPVCRSSAHQDCLQPASEIPEYNRYCGAKMGLTKNGRSYTR